MSELLAHLVGDYVLQNHVMATRKTMSSVWAAIHVVCYTLPFLFLTRSPAALAVIAGTHFLIDRYRLAGCWVRFYGNGVPGWLPTELHNFRRESYALKWMIDHPVAGRFEQARRIYDKYHPLPDPAPPFLAAWLTIIIDNTFHLLVNHLAIGL